MNFTDYPPIETERLILRLLHSDDIELTFQLRSHPEVGQYIARPLLEDRKGAVAHINRVSKLMEENTSIIWVICLKDTMEDVGTICLWNFSEDRKTAETGYDSLPQFQGNGYMAEAMKAVLQFGTESLKVNTFEAYTSYQNAPSVKLLEKHGFILQKDKRDEGFPDNRIYALSV